MRENANQRRPRACSSAAYCELIQVSGVRPVISGCTFSQHQSSQKRSAPSRSNGRWSAKYAASCFGFSQSNPMQVPVGSAWRISHSPPAGLSGPDWDTVAEYSGSLVSIEGWMLSATESPWLWAQSRNRCGSGNSDESHSQPFQAYGTPGAPLTVAPGMAAAVVSPVFQLA